MLGITLLTGAMHAHAELEVLGRDAGAAPATALVGELLSRFAQPLDNAPRQTWTIPDIREDAAFPIASDLKPSVRETGVLKVDVPLVRPICVIGNDRISRNWLSRNRARLIEMGAACMLVQVRDRPELEDIRRSARPLTVQAAPFDDLARRLGVRNIPILLVGS